MQNFFNEKLSERISIQCDCLYPQENLVNGSLHCPTVASSNILIYRVYIVPTNGLTSKNVIEHLEESLKSNPTLLSGVASISVDTTCNMSISSPGDPICDDTEVTGSGLNTCDKAFLDGNTLILIAVIAGIFFILLIFVIIVMIFMLIFQHKRLK